MQLDFRRTLNRAIRQTCRHLRIPAVRTMREFAETEIYLPSGPYQGRRFSCDRQPFAGLWFDLIDSGKWPRRFAVGPVQSGKTLCGSVIPSLYHLFEVGENVVFGVPDANMIADKWNEDLLPVIEKTKYRELLPGMGSSSRGGEKVMSIRFNNGATLRFMTAGGKDKARAGFTSRVLICTEVDGFDHKSEQGREGDKFAQLEDRLQAFGSRRVVYGECTVSVKTGRTWREYESGTCSKISRPCPHCDKWVTPEREHLLGWEDAEDINAAAGATIYCPECGEAWSEEDRVTANAKSKVVHRGQEVADGGVIVGEAARTDTLGFRWTATDNHFLGMGDVGQREWKAKYSPGQSNPDLEETTIRQKYWTIPPDPDSEDAQKLDDQTIMRRKGETDEWIVPAWATRLTIGVDVGKYLLHWVATAWGQHATSRIVGYGRAEVASDAMQPERAVELAIIELSEAFSAAFKDEEGDPVSPSNVWVDSGYLPDAVYSACAKIKQKANEIAVRAGRREDRRVWWPCKGFGESVENGLRYKKPKTVGGSILRIGEGSHLSSLTKDGATHHLWHVDADHWKGWLHRRLVTPVENPGSLTLFRRSDRYGHVTIAKHLTSEKQERHFVAGKGTVIKWVPVHRNNHYLDAASYSCAAGWWADVRLAEEHAPASKAAMGAGGPAEPTPRPKIRAMKGGIRRPRE